MFEPYEEEVRQTRTPKQKQIHFLMNGFPDKIFAFQYKWVLNKEEIIRVCEKNWGLNKYKNIRLFSIQGVEIFEEDLLYVRDGDRVYVSKGEQFDSNRNFGEYQLIRVLGQGGFGKVSLGRNIITNEYAAIKVMKLGKIYNANDIDMIFRQIENLKALSHPNIVKILNCYTLQNMQVVVVMQYLEGGQLLSLLNSYGFFEEHLAKKIFKQIVSAINYCHQKNIIHRDLKLENILLKNQGEFVIKVADFGISGVADQFNPDVDTGTLKYMSPEVLSGKEKSNTPAVDVWACGVILYCMLYGCLPFKGNSSTEITKAIISGKFIFPKEPTVSQECKQLMQLMLDLNPKTRIKMDDIGTNLWITNPSYRHKTQILGKLTQISQQKGQSLIQIVKKPLFKTKYMKIPKRLQKQKIKIMQEIQIYLDHRKAFKSEAKPTYFQSQELPSLYGGMRSRGKLLEEQLILKKKRPSVMSNLWK